MAILKDNERGTWYVTLRKKDAITGKYVQVKRRGFATKREAKDWEAEQRTVKTVVKTAVTFRELDDKYIEYKNPPKMSTRNQEKHRVGKYMASFCDLPLSEVTKGMLMEWYTDLVKQDVSVSVKNYCIGVVRSVYQFGHNVYGFPNDAAMLKKLKKDKKKADMVTWTVPEFNRFLEEVEGEHYRNFFYFVYWTGLRRGEALALRAEDFDLDEGTFYVYHQIKYFKDGFFDLKTDASERTLKIPPSLQAFLKPILERCTEEAPFVFGGEVSLPITNVRRRLNDAIKRSGVKPIRLHDFRHSFATNLIGSGANIVAVSHYLGHSTIQQTLDTYTHLLEKADDQMVDLVEALIGQNS